VIVMQEQTGKMIGTYLEQAPTIYAMLEKPLYSSAEISMDLP
jgi:hypothetical protein